VKRFVDAAGQPLHPGMDDMHGPGLSVPGSRGQGQIARKGVLGVFMVLTSKLIESGDEYL
jgi:hypothetical protein